MSKRKRRGESGKKMCNKILAAQGDVGGGRRRRIAMAANLRPRGPPTTAWEKLGAVRRLVPYPTAPAPLAAPARLRPQAPPPPAPPAPASAPPPFPSSLPARALSRFLSLSSSCWPLVPCALLYSIESSRVSPAGASLPASSRSGLPRSFSSPIRASATVPVPCLPRRSLGAPLPPLFLPCSCCWHGSLSSALLRPVRMG